jgi:hypothetical protein
VFCSSFFGANGRADFSTYRITDTAAYKRAKSTAVTHSIWSTD